MHFHLLKLILLNLGRWFLNLFQAKQVLTEELHAQLNVFESLFPIYIIDLIKMKICKETHYLLINSILVQCLQKDHVQFWPSFRKQLKKLGKVSRRAYKWFNMIYVEISVRKFFKICANLDEKLEPLSLGMFGKKDVLLL